MSQLLFDTFDFTLSAALMWSVHICVFIQRMWSLSSVAQTEILATGRNSELTSNKAFAACLFYFHYINPSLSAQLAHIKYSVHKYSPSTWIFLHILWTDMDLIGILLYCIPSRFGRLTKYIIINSYRYLNNKIKLNAHQKTLFMCVNEKWS